jgi:hypothetical protein
MKMTLLLIVVTVLCVGCNEEELKKKHKEDIAALQATHKEAIAALVAGQKAAIDAKIANFRRPGPDMPLFHHRLAKPIEAGAAILFAILLVATIRALIRQMAGIDRQRGAHIGWIMVLVGIMTTVAASIIAPEWVGFPYRPVLWFTTIARPASWWGNLLAILAAALASFAIAYYLMRLRGSEIPTERKWACSLIILGLTFVGSHYKLACCSMIFNIGSITGYLIYPISVGELIGGMLGTAAYWIGNPEPEPCPVVALPPANKEQARLMPVIRESHPARLTDEDEEVISKYLPRIVELAIRMFAMRH